MTEIKKSELKTTKSTQTMNTITDFLNQPLGRVLCNLVKGMVSEILADPEAMDTLVAMVAPEVHTTKAAYPDSLDADGALEFLNSHGYTISKGQLYKETSNGTIPFHKFGNKLHFKTEELKAWAESRLVNGNAVGFLPPPESKPKKGGRR